MTEPAAHGQVLRPDDPAGRARLVWRLACPECGDTCVEQQGPGPGDHAAVTVQPDRDAHDSPIGTRGGYVKIELFCPSGHGFDLVIANHKGCEYVGIVPAGDRDYATAAGWPDGGPVS